MTEKTTEEKLQQALCELEELKRDKAKGKQGWAVFHDIRNKRLGQLDVSIEFLVELSDSDWQMAFENVRVLRAMPDIFKGVVEYICMGPMFDVVKEGYSIPRYQIVMHRTTEGTEISYEKI